ARTRYARQRYAWQRYARHANRWLRCSSSAGRWACGATHLAVVSIATRRLAPRGLFRTRRWHQVARGGLPLSRGLIWLACHKGDARPTRWINELVVRVGEGARMLEALFGIL